MRIDAKTFLAGLVASDSHAMPDYARQASALLSRVRDDEQRAGLRYEFEERAAIHEYDANLPRVEAERLALQHLRALLSAALEGDLE